MRIRGRCDNRFGFESWADNEFILGGDGAIAMPNEKGQRARAIANYVPNAVSTRGNRETFCELGEFGRKRARKFPQKPAIVSRSSGSFRRANFLEVSQIADALPRLSAKFNFLYRQVGSEKSNESTGSYGTQLAL